MRRIAFLLLAFPAAHAGDDPLKAQVDEIERLVKEQREYADKEMSDDLRKAVDCLIANWWSMKGRAENPDVWVPSVSGYAQVYSHWALTDRAKGTQALELAKLEDPRAVKVLTDQLFDTVKTIAAMDKLLRVSRPVAFWWVHDQVPGVQRYGAMAYQKYLIAALASREDPASRAYLADPAWKKATAIDRRTRRDLARIALIDVYARNGCPQVTERLHALAQGKEPRLRIVALEALAARGDPGATLRERLVAAACDDRCYAVRATAIELLRELGDGQSIGPLASAFARRTGTERSRIHEALVHIVGRDLGWLPESWSAWFESNRIAVAKGEWRSPHRKQGSAAAPKVARFDEMAVPSLRPLVILDGNYNGNWPADMELAQTQNYWKWHNTKGRNRDYVTQWDVFRRETLKYVASLPEDAAFNVLAMYGSGQLTPLAERGAVAAGPAGCGKAERFVDKFAPDLGWCAAVCAIWKAYDLAGIDIWGTELPDEPAFDTIVLAADATFAIGPLIDLEATLLDVERNHRFCRIPIHCYRLGYVEGTGPLMEGIARRTGGQYQWRKKP